ncbi:MAG TPA: hypothetical protein VIW67_22650 [Terriglobales bacterium]
MGYIELNQIAYVTHIPDDGRDVLLSTYYDQERKQWISYTTHQRKILELPVSNLVEGLYIAEAPADKDSDVRTELAEFVLQYFAVPSLTNIDDQMAQDLVNQLASVHKYFVILHHMNTYDDGTEIGLMTSEIEYAFANHRSFYDLLNRAVKEVIRHTTRRANELPDSFRRVAQQESKALVEKFGLPAPLIDFYKGKERIFMMLRSIRDNILHHGKTPDYVYHFEDGFGLSIDRHLLADLKPLGLWPDELLKQNRIGSLLAVLNFLARDIFDTTNVLARQLKQCFEKLPPAVAEGYHAYLRSRLTPHLIRSDEYAARHWFRPEEVLELKVKQR